MGVQNTKKLQNWILSKDISDKETISETIEAFSEFLVAINPDYLYNKTYLKSFVNEFLKCKKILKEKSDILLNRILLDLTISDMDLSQIVITMDDTWKYKNGKMELLNTFNVYDAKATKMKVVIEYTGENGFVVADEIKIDSKYEEKLKRNVDLFKARLEEIRDGKTL